MLSSDSLRQHAQERGMPAGKLRGSAREYLQVVILKALYGLNASKSLAFLGGTALRLDYGLPRFSEGLDFDVLELSLRAWRSLLEEAAHGLARLGLAPEVRAEERGALLASNLRFKGFLQAYGLGASASERLQIKVEANRPRYALRLEPRVISGYGEMFPVPFAALILERVRGWGRARLTRMARRLEPFLFEPQQARLVAEADALLPSILDYLGQRT